MIAVAQVDREERDVRARDLEVVRVEEPVRAEQDSPASRPRGAAGRRAVPSGRAATGCRRPACSAGIRATSDEKSVVVCLVHRFALDVDARRLAGAAGPCRTDPCCTSSARRRSRPGCAAAVCGCSSPPAGPAGRRSERRGRSTRAGCRRSSGVVRVAEPETNAKPAALRAARSRPGPPGCRPGRRRPGSAEFDAKRSATWIACAVSGSCVSPTTMRNFFLLFDAVVARHEVAGPPSCCGPIEAAGPVTGAATPIVLVLPQVISAGRAPASRPWGRT